jgi:hypothetical protein
MSELVQYNAGKKASAVTRPIIQDAPGGSERVSPGKYACKMAGKPSAKLNVNRTRMSSQLTSILTGIPSRRNKRQRVPNIVVLMV